MAKPNIIPNTLLHEERAGQVPSPRYANTLASKRHTNGLSESGAYIKIGSKLFVDLDKFDAWFLSHTEAA